MALRDLYPHPSHRGQARKVPSPVAVERWLGEAMRLDHLAPRDFPRVLAAAQAAAQSAQAHPDVWRKTLQNWIREARWLDAVEEVQEGPALPPPTSGPRFTPDDW